MNVPLQYHGKMESKPNAKLPISKKRHGEAILNISRVNKKDKMSN